MNLFATLRDEGFRTSAAEGRIADSLRNGFEFAVNASITNLAGCANVSPPTMTRFCRRLRCDGYSDMNIEMDRTAHVGGHHLKPKPESKATGDVAEDVVEPVQNAHVLFHRALDLKAIEKAADTIAGADMIDVFGSDGNSSTSAGAWQNRLFRRGLRVTASADHARQLQMAATARKGDVPIESFLSGRHSELAHSLTLACGQIVDPEGVVAAVAFLASPQATAITDVCLPVDCGLTAGQVEVGRASTQSPHY